MVRQVQLSASPGIRHGDPQANQPVAKTPCVRWQGNTFRVRGGEVECSGSVDHTQAYNGQGSVGVARLYADNGVNISPSWEPIPSSKGASSPETPPRGGVFPSSWGTPGFDLRGGI